jgi:hypothetical protein
VTKHERNLRRLAQQHGYSVHQADGGHWQLRHPSGALVIAAKTPGDGGSLRVLAGCLRREICNCTSKEDHS